MFQLEIFNKKGFSNSESESIKKESRDIGVPFDGRIEVSYLYIVEGKITLKELKTICEKLLIDPVVQKFLVHKVVSYLPSLHSKPPLQAAQKFIVDVHYKKGVMDPVADTLIFAIRDIGINKDLKIKTGKRYLFEMKNKNIQPKVLEKIAEKILCNTIIQEYKINASNYTKRQNILQL